jgi:CheY-like chemotaxis protein
MSSDKPGTRVVCCPSCRRYYRIAFTAAVTPETRLRCTGCGHVFQLAPGGLPAQDAPTVYRATQAGAGPRVLVASDGGDLRAVVEEVLLKGGYSYRSVVGGDEAWRQIGEWSPQAAVLDVGLPGMPVFEICDRIRRDPTHGKLGIVLLASVYRHTRYKRSPTSLYGADDYIEKHHLRDSLTGKIARLIPERSAAPPGGAGLYPPPVREEAMMEKRNAPGPEKAAREEETLVREEQFGSREAARESADNLNAPLKRFARIIMADIALYNQELVEEGIRMGSLRQLLQKEIAEGRRLFETRLKPGFEGGDELYNRAIEEFVSRQGVRFGYSGESGGGGSR